MTFTQTQIQEAIDAWAETQVDAEIARKVEYNKKRVAESVGNRYFNANYYPVEVEKFNRNQVRDQIAEQFYEEDTELEIPGLGTVKLVDSYGGEGQGEEFWRVYEIDGEFYQANHYYNSYDVDPWHNNASISPVVPKQVTVTRWV